MASEGPSGQTAKIKFSVFKGFTFTCKFFYVKPPVPPLGRINKASCLAGPVSNLRKASAKHRGTTARAGGAVQRLRHGP